MLQVDLKIGMAGRWTPGYIFMNYEQTGRRVGGARWDRHNERMRGRLLFAVNGRGKGAGWGVVKGLAGGPVSCE
jgi:hypothetical protein